MARKVYTDPNAYARDILKYHKVSHKKIDKIHKDSAIYFLEALNAPRSGKHPNPGFPVITNWMRSTIDVFFNKNWDTKKGEPSIADPTQPDRKASYSSSITPQISKIKGGPFLAKINIAIKAFYARYVEEGTSTMEPRKFMYSQLMKWNQFVAKAKKHNKWSN